MISKEHEERINRDASGLPASAAAEGLRACYAYGAINERYIADKEIAKLTEALSVAMSALEYVRHRTGQSHPAETHPHGFIRSTKMRGVILQALDKISEMKL